MEGNVTVEKCPQCGAPVNLRKRQCDYCEAELLITSLAYLDNFDSNGINKYINHYKQLLKAEPENGEVNMAMGICYLDLRIYDLAINFFTKAINLMPDCSDGYYYYAIALIKGRKPKIMPLAEIKKVEEYLNAAIQIDDSKAIYYYLWALIKYDYYIQNGLMVRPPSFEQLVQEASYRECNRQEMEKMLQRVPVQCPYLQNTYWR